MTDDGPPLCPLCRCVCQDHTRLYCPTERSARGGTRLPRGGDKGFLFNCTICGSFVITRNDHEIMLGEETRNDDDALRLSTLLRERKIQKMTTAWIRCRGDDQYATLVQGELAEPVNCVPMSTRELLSRWPNTVPGKLDRTLSNLAEHSQKGGASIELQPQDRGVCFASDSDEMRFHIDSLEEQGLLQEVKHSLDSVSRAVVSAEGWAKYDELTGGAGSGPAHTNPLSP